MTDSIESNFWADADQAMHRGWMRRRPMPAHQPAPPDVSVPDEVDYTMDLEQFAEQRAALGIKTAASDFAKIDEAGESGFPDANTRVGREHLAATGIPVPPAGIMPSAGRELDQDYQSAAHYAAQRTSVGVAPITSKTIRTTNPK
jgi:hypothetical protein